MHVKTRTAGPFSELDEVNCDSFLHIILSPEPSHDRAATVINAYDLSHTNLPPSSFSKVQS